MGVHVAWCIFLAGIIGLCSPGETQNLNGVFQKVEQYEAKVDNLAGQVTALNLHSRGKRGTRNLSRVPLVQMSSGRYLLSEQKVNWFQAMFTCQLLGLQLATPDTRLKDADMLSLIGEDKYVWIAGTDLGTEGTFYWATTGKDVIYANFINRKEPDNDDEEEHCLHYWKKKQVNDVDCAELQRFICEEIKQ